MVAKFHCQWQANFPGVRVKSQGSGTWYVPELDKSMNLYRGHWGGQEFTDIMLEV
jgi:hypothetical protein